MAIITISRGSLSGGAQLAHQLGERLGARVISREVIVEAAKKYGVSEDDLAEGISTPPGLWDRMTHHKERYVVAIQATLAEMVQQGQTIYHGHGGQFLLKDLSKVIKLRLIAPIEYRVRAAMAELKLSRENAVRHIEQVDEQRAKWVRLLYGVEWADPALYDLVLNLEHVSIETACELVVDLVGRKEYRRTPEMMQERKDFALATRIRAELTFNSSFPQNGVLVGVRHGNLKLSGPYYDKHRDEVVQLVRKVPGAQEAMAGDEEGPAPLMRSTVQEKTAADVMLPINAYPFIHKWISIKEAFAALATSTVKLHDGHVFRPRYILVHDEMEQLVGVVARRSLLRGLTPQLKELERTWEKIEAMGAGFAQMSYPMTFRWVSLFGSAALAAAKEPVETVMSPIRCTVRPDDDLSAVVATMLQFAVDLVPVVAERKPVGVILMTDVFDTVAEHVMEGKTRPARHDDEPDPDKDGEQA
jgi:cytidylate kinase/CBS domain-containing protein